MHFYMDNNISDEEIIAAVKQLSSEKSPGPDGYIGAFFKQCWDIIGHDVTVALRVLFPQGQMLELTQLSKHHSPKKDSAQGISDFRPISVMHSVTELLGNVPANRLALLLDLLVSRS
jgi:hypothetical protein